MPILPHTSPWNLRNRTSWKVIERLGEMSKTGPILAVGSGGPIDSLTKPQQATAFVEAGEHFLFLAIDTAATVGGRGRGDRKVLKAITPESGARAAVFITHALAACTERISSTPGHHLSPERHRHVRELLAAHFALSEADAGVVEDLAAGIDPTAGDGYFEADLGTSFHAIAMLIGEELAHALPGFARLANRDLVDAPVQLAWEICFNHAKTPYSELADPHGMSAWRSGERSR